MSTVSALECGSHHAGTRGWRCVGAPREATPIGSSLWIGRRLLGGVNRSWERFSGQISRCVVARCGSYRMTDVKVRSVDHGAAIGAVHRRNLGCRNGMGAARMRSRSRTGDLPQPTHPDPQYDSRWHPNRAAESNRDTFAVNLSRCAHRPARVMAGTAVGAPCRLGIPGLNGREFLPKGHLPRLMIALSVL